MHINFDANASVRPIKKVREFLACYSGEFLNPSSIHSFGRQAKAVIDEATYEVLSLLGAKSGDKVIFLSGASEANNFALQTNFSAKDNKSIELACSDVEHSSVLECLRRHASNGYGYKEIPIRILQKENDLSSYINDDLRVFSLMAANNETGEIFDVRSVSQNIKKISPRVRIHCDAVQAAGKLAVNFSDWNVDSMSISGHKIGALSGVGALIIAEHVQLDPLILGGPQQYGLRAGTENMLGIKTLAIACREAKQRLAHGQQQALIAKEKFMLMLSELGDRIELTKLTSSQLPNTISIRIPGIKADDFVVALDLNSVAISAGSACLSGKPSPSHVLLALGISPAHARETVRVSFEPEITAAEIDHGLLQFKQAVLRMSEQRRAA